MREQLVIKPNFPVNKDFEKIAVFLNKGQKRALVNYTELAGLNLTTVVRNLVDQLLEGKINLDFTPRARKRVKK